MSDAWHYIRDNNSTGPVSYGQLRTLLLSGHGGSKTLVWRKGLSEWRPAGEIEELADIFQVTAPAPRQPARLASAQETSNSSSRLKRLISWGLAIAFTCLMVAAIRVLVYGGVGVGGIGNSVGHLLGTSLIPLVIAFFAGRGSRNGAIPFTIAIAVGAAVVLLSGAGHIRDNIDLWSARTALQGAPNGSDLKTNLQKAARANPSNPAIALYAEAARVEQEAERLAQELTASIEPAGLDSLDFRTANRDQLQSYLRDLRTAQMNAEGVFPKYTQLMKSTRDAIERFAKTNGTSVNLTNDLLATIDMRQAEIRDLLSKMLEAKAELYGAIGDRCAILIEQFGKFQVGPNDQFLFSDRSALARFNATGARINNAGKRIAQVMTDAAQMHKVDLEELRQAVGN